MLNRKQRRASKKYHSVNSKRMDNDQFFSRPDAMVAFGPKKYFKRFYQNSLFSVQVYDMCRGVQLAGIRRHDEKTSVFWRQKQDIKNKIFGKEFTALEVFPPEEDLIDQANIYWIWVFDIWPKEIPNLKKYLESY